MPSRVVIPYISNGDRIGGVAQNTFLSNASSLSSNLSSVNIREEGISYQNFDFTDGVALTFSDEVSSTTDFDIDFDTYQVLTDGATEMNITGINTTIRSESVIRVYARILIGEVDVNTPSDDLYLFRIRVHTTNGGNTDLLPEYVYSIAACNTTNNAGGQNDWIERQPILIARQFTYIGSTDTLTNVSIMGRVSDDTNTVEVDSFQLCVEVITRG